MLCYSVCCYALLFSVCYALLFSVISLSIKLYNNLLFCNEGLRMLACTILSFDFIVCVFFVKG